MRLACGCRLEFVITIKCILNIANITQPVIGIILGPASSWKSKAVNMPKGARDAFGVDSFSPKSFVSHNSNLNEDTATGNRLTAKDKEQTLHGSRVVATVHKQRGRLGADNWNDC